MSKSTFLPFIKETSSEDVVFKAILKRTKGSATSALTNLFSVVLGAGIENVRTKIDSLDDNLATSAKVAEVVAQETEYHIPQSERSFWSYVAKYYMPKTPRNLTNTELEIFFTVIAVHRPENLAVNGFVIESNLLEKLVEFSKETCEPGIADVPGVAITEKSEFRTGFTCWEEFKAFLAMISNDEVETEVSPVYIKTASDVVTAHIYSENHCISPYIGKNNET